MTFFFSDPHFGHVNMALRRGFKTVEEHDEYIVKRWNETVSKRDVVYLIGDITMEKKNYSILSRLNGIIKVVLGNHDSVRKSHTEELLKYVNGVAGCIKLKNAILTHIPIHESEMDRFSMNIHGHIHERNIGGKYLNVSAENLFYTPIKMMFDTDDLREVIDGYLDSLLKTHQNRYKQYLYKYRLDEARDEMQQNYLKHINES